MVTPNFCNWTKNNIYTKINVILKRPKHDLLQKIIYTNRQIMVLKLTKYKMHPLYKWIYFSNKILTILKKILFQTQNPALCCTIFYNSKHCRVYKCAWKDKICLFLIVTVMSFIRTYESYLKMHKPQPKWQSVQFKIYYRLVKNDFFFFIPDTFRLKMEIMLCESTKKVQSKSKEFQKKPWL